MENSRFQLKDLLSKFIPLIFLAFGIWVFFGPIFLKHFGQYWAAEGDGLFHIYILEHNYQYILQNFPHCNLFNPPFYYPNNNVLLYSDPYISVTPFYAIFRQFLNEAQSFTFLLILTHILNYCGLYFILKNKLKLNIFASSAGAYLFVFSTFNQMQLTYEHHSQMIYSFFIMLSLYALFSINKHNTLFKNIFWVNLFYISIVLSVCNAYAITWYYCFSLILYSFSMLLFKRTRKQLIIFIKRFWCILLFGIIPALILLYPMIHHYLEMNNFHWEYYGTPTIREFFTNFSIYNSFMSKFNITPFAEKNCGTEYLTALIAIFGISRFKYQRKAIFAFLIILFLLIINIKGFTLWEYIFRYFPGANGIRTNQRILVVYNFFAAFGCAYFINNFIKVHNKKLAAKLSIMLLTAILCIGQISYIQGFGYENYDVYDSVNNHIMDIEKYSKIIKERNCKLTLFYFNKLESEYSGMIQDAYSVKAMWIAMKNKVYTLNGYSGYAPNQSDRPLTKEEEASLCAFEINYP